MHSSNIKRDTFFVHCRSLLMTHLINARQYQELIPKLTLNGCKNYNKHIFRPSVFFKEPLLSIIRQILEQITPPCLLNYKIYKTNIKQKLLEIQSNGNEDDWLPDFFNIPCLSKTSLKRVHVIVSYQE